MQYYRLDRRTCVLTGPHVSGSFVKNTDFRALKQKYDQLLASTLECGQNGPNFASVSKLTIEVLRQIASEPSNCPKLSAEQAAELLSFIRLSKRPTQK